MATVEDLYRQVLGREPDPEGKAFWESAFGGSVDPMEQASFMQSVQSVLASAPPAQQATLAPKLVAEATATGVPVTTVAASVPPPVALTAPVNPTVKLYQDTLGRTPTQEEIDSWNFGDTVDARELDRFLGYARNEAVNTMPTTGAAGKIASEILAQGTTDKWGGEGFGSATKNAFDMAVMLAGQGLTSINDFGQRTTADGNKEFFNKATGEAIKPYYDKAARVGPDVWGGTFAGKDSTAYGVQFDANGKPLFYSQYGGDSSDVPSWVVPALVLGGAYFGLDASGLLSGTAGTATAGLTAAEAAGLGLTASEAAALGLSASEFAAAGGLGAGFTAAGLPSGVGTFLGENVVSGIPAWDTAFTTAGGMFNSAFGLPAGNGAFLGEGVPSGVPAWDTAYTAAGGVFDPAFALGPDGLVGTPLTPVTTPPTTTTTPPIDITKIPPSLITAILGGVVAPKVLNPTTPTPMGVGALPTQGVPLNTADYYNAIQQNYNRLLPAVPRDVATPLAQWYNSQYGA